MSWIIIFSAAKLTRQAMILNILYTAGYFSSSSCTISSTLLIVYRIYNSLSNRDNHSKKRFMHIVDVLVQSAAVYSLTLIFAAITEVVLITSGNFATLSMFAVLDYGIGIILPFVSVRTFGIQILGNV